MDVQELAKIRKSVDSLKEFAKQGKVAVGFSVDATEIALVFTPTLLGGEVPQEVLDSSMELLEHFTNAYTVAWGIELVCGDKA